MRQLDEEESNLLLDPVRRQEVNVELIFRVAECGWDISSQNGGGSQEDLCLTCNTLNSRLPSGVIEAPYPSAQETEQLCVRLCASGPQPPLEMQLFARHKEHFSALCARLETGPCRHHANRKYQKLSKAHVILKTCAKCMLMSFEGMPINA